MTINSYSTPSTHCQEKESADAADLKIKKPSGKEDADGDLSTTAMGTEQETAASEKSD